MRETVPIDILAFFATECFEGLHQEEYTRKLRTGLLETKILWTLSAHNLDQLIADRLCDLARYDQDMAERVKAAYESQRGHKMDETTLLRGQIERTQQQIQRLDFLLKTRTFLWMKKQQRRMLKTLQSYDQN